MNIFEVRSRFSEVCFATAINVFPMFGKNDKNKSDEIAVNTMRKKLSELEFGTRIVIGEGEKDDAPMLYAGEVLGKGEVLYDLVVDPLECTTNFSKGLPNSMSVLGFSEKNGIRSVPGTYMEQWVAGPKMKLTFNLNVSIEKNIKALSDCLEKKIQDLVIVVQERPRHESLIAELRRLGVKVSLIDSGSLTAVLDICLEGGYYDAMIGTYGAPEGLMAALIAKCTYSEMKGIIKPHNDKTKEEMIQMGFKEDEILNIDSLISGVKIGFVAACISPNVLMSGVRNRDNHLQTDVISILRDIPATKIRMGVIDGT
ncbi:MAG: fructose-bisphosphatase class II [Leptospiraceae bacterium]|nr:fructose-bisphosphatase class II [Leptospiraceae bacterium]